MFLNLKASNKIAIKDDKSEISYDDLIKASEIFKEISQIKSVILCLCSNNIESIVGYIASIEGDHVPLLVSSNMDSQLLNNLLETYRPQYIWMNKDKSIELQFNEIVVEYNDYVLIKTENQSYELNSKLELLLTTSGSTGSPKLVRHKKGNVESNALNISLAFGWDETEKGLLDLPLNYTMGLSVVNTHLFLGATCYITQHNPINREYWNILSQEEITNITGVPFSYEIMDKLKFTKKVFPKLRYICQGGGKLSKVLFEKLSKYSTDNNILFYATYGATETTARMTMLDPKEASTNPQSIGRAMPLGNTWLKDEVNGVGELVYRGPNVTMGYASQISDLALDDEWNGEYSTGDLVKRDGNGNLTIVGRLKRFLKLSGHRVGLDDLESLLISHFETTFVCVGTDKLMRVFYKSTGDLKTSEIKLFISEKTGLFHTLYNVQSVNEIMRKDNGKIDYSYYNNLLEE